MPDVFFGCNSLISLRATHIEFNPTTEFNGLSSLVTLQLNEVNITDNALEKILSSCPILSNLYLKSCFSLGSVKISGPDLRLKSLSLILTDAVEIDIFAPNLRSMHFYGDVLCGFLFRNVASLVDVFISADGYECHEPEYDFIQILSGVSHVKILTVCIGAPMNITTAEMFRPEDLSIFLPNLLELQILV
ncbi:F-box protein [Thalictrum thalictroides]|uniref:F-box protein n=1 Tax=Thalictrum thalictroides TaxID=46969 RepID=A0A7J6UWP3_THATH|nr:F-box protein [Thalictrum thalictroides]